MDNCIPSELWLCSGGTEGDIVSRDDIWIYFLYKVTPFLRRKGGRAGGREEGRREEEREAGRIKESKGNGKEWHGAFSITCIYRRIMDTISQFCKRTSCCLNTCSTGRQSLR